MVILWRRVSPIQAETGDFAADPRSTALLRQSSLWDANPGIIIRAT